jgi:serine/threonine protein kinase
MLSGRRIQEGGFGVVMQVKVDSMTVARKYYRTTEHYPNEVRWNTHINQKEGSDIRTKFIVKMLRAGYDKNASRYFIDMELAVKALYDVAVVNHRPSGCPELSSAAKVEGLIVDVLNGLEFLHSSVEMLHNDIKSENILLKADGTYAFCDFGCAMSMHDSYKNHGTDCFAAPEHFDDTKLTVDGTADVFSLGVTLLEVFEGYHGVPLPRVVYYGEDRGKVLKVTETNQDGRRAIARMQKFEFFKNKFHAPLATGTNVAAVVPFKWQYTTIVKKMVQPFDRPGCKELLQLFRQLMLDERNAKSVQQCETEGTRKEVVAKQDDIEPVKCAVHEDADKKCELE